VETFSAGRGELEVEVTNPDEIVEPVCVLLIVLHIFSFTNYEYYTLIASILTIYSLKNEDIMNQVYS